MNLPAAYRWLDALTPPRTIVEALKLYGIAEVAGGRHNPIILAWADELGLAAVYRADEVPWCGLFAGVVVRRASWDVVRDPLWARNWSRFGVVVPDRPCLGDVLVFSRPGGGGHVGFYVAEDAEAYHVLGGNQGDRVSIARLDKGRLIDARRPRWRFAQPDSVRRYLVAADGALSTNEA